MAVTAISHQSHVPQQFRMQTNGSNGSDDQSYIQNGKMSCGDIAFNGNPSKSKSHSKHLYGKKAYSHTLCGSVPPFET